MNIRTLLASAVALVVSASAFAAGTTTVQKVDFSGKPPFKRKLVTLEVVDAAQLENTETSLVTSTDFSGKPPFKRNVEKLEVVDAAALEATTEETSVQRRGKPPFKRN